MRPVPQILRFFIACYQWSISPMLGAACRFTPSCSHYADEALKTLPLNQALAKIVCRLLRCRPFGGHGYDPVRPETLTR